MTSNERNYAMTAAAIILAAAIALGFMEGWRFGLGAIVGVVIVMAVMWAVASRQRVD